MNGIKIHIVAVVFLFLAACRESGQVRVRDGYPSIYPDYLDVTIPMNIAPLNFMVRDSVGQLRVCIKGADDSIVVVGDYKIQIPEKHWKALLHAVSGGDLTVVVTAKMCGEWVQYKPFNWHVTNDKIDPFLSYRLIEPGYEVWNKLQIVERNIETFAERTLADNNLTDGRCMNCHVHGNQDGALSMFHLRGGKGGTILNRNGRLRKINTKIDGMISNAVYGNFHPSGRFGVFSTNIIIPELHAYRNKRLEVYDTASDLVVLDFDENRAILQPLLCDSTTLETFPVFSADGKWIYFCSAPAVPLPDSIKSLKYHICRVAFDADKKEIGATVDTIWNAREMNGSACHLKTSPDGKFLLYTVADYGTFPIWHQEADLRLMNLETRTIDNLPIVNGPNSDSYHSWSSNSRWFVFASKRDDGIYGKPYFCYIDPSGKAHKPFVLPQRDPEMYDFMLKSFNIPELSSGPAPFDASDVERIYKQKEAEPFR
jgi:hypothetical protein